VATIPFTQDTFDRFGMLLARFNIRNVHIPVKKENMHLLRLVKDALGLNVPGKNSILCECGNI
jgi:hypothetical protein